MIKIFADLYCSDTLLCVSLFLCPPILLNCHVNIETDLNKIKKIAKEKEDENWEFRAFLKNLDIERAELDAIVQKIADQITPKIDCTECANCCKGLSPILEKEDINTLSCHLDMSSDEFIDKYLELDEDSDYTFTSTPCPFLENNLCTVYEHRLTTCRSYPHLYKSGFVFRLWGIIQNYEYCPIVFNVFNQLKAVIPNH